MASSSQTKRAAPVRFYRDDVFNFGDNVGFMMKRVTVSLLSQMDKRLNEHGLTGAQWAPLLRMKSCGTSTVAEMARAMYMDAGAMTRLLDRLEKKGLVRRIRSTEDRRVVNVELTPEGEAVVAEVPAVLCDVLNAHLVGFTKAEWQLMRKLLTRMIENGEALRDAD